MGNSCDKSKKKYQSIAIFNADSKNKVEELKRKCKFSRVFSYSYF